jgi:hypothetical protein
MRMLLTAARIALWSLAVLTAIASCHFLGQNWYEQRREEIAEQRAAEFMRYSSAEWASVGDACNAYWQVAKDMKDEFAAKPPLPPLLENLTVRYLEVYPGSDGFTLYWSDGFFGDDRMCLKYDVTDGKRRLSLNCVGHPYREVWSEVAASPR